MADLSLAQGLIAAAKPRGVAADIFARQAQEQALAQQRGFAIGERIAAPLARDIATGEYAPDPERFQLLQELYQQDPGRFQQAKDKFDEFSRILI